jgi:hypothetical protein
MSEIEVKLTRGLRFEDTILVGPETNEVLTEIRDWPTVRAQVGNQVYMRPAILEA